MCAPSAARTPPRTCAVCGAQCCRVSRRPPCPSGCCASATRVETACRSCLAAGPARRPTPARSAKSLDGMSERLPPFAEGRALARREHFVCQHHLVGVVQAKLKLGVGNDDTLCGGVVPSLFRAHAVPSAQPNQPPPPQRSPDRHVELDGELLDASCVLFANQLCHCRQSQHCAVGPSKERTHSPSSGWMFSSCCPGAALVLGVNSGRANASLSCMPAGSLMPCTVPVRSYSVHALPVK